MNAIKFKADRNDAIPAPQENGAYYRVSEDFYKRCQEAGEDLIIDVAIENLYDEDAAKYPSSRFKLLRRDGQPMLGLFSRPQI